MKDTDKMPFGIHRGKAMANVPADYLIYMGDNWEKYPQMRHYPEVKKYIEDNIGGLKKEVKK